MFINDKRFYLLLHIDGDNYIFSDNETYEEVALNDNILGKE